MEDIVSVRHYERLGVGLFLVRDDVESGGGREGALYKMPDILMLGLRATDDWVWSRQGLLTTIM